MAIQLSIALETTPDFWLNLQTQHDLWLASQQERPEIHSLFAFA
jgi:plasmid maintenance system antidote protein VapI